jgi:tetratricopeptide (TPR) repeat protein
MKTTYNKTQFSISTRLSALLLLFVMVFVATPTSAQDRSGADKQYSADGKKAFSNGDYDAAARAYMYTTDAFRKANPKAQYEFIYACLESKRINIAAASLRENIPMKGPKKMPSNEDLSNDVFGLESEYLQALKEAAEHLNKGAYRKALEAADMAIDTDPNYPDAYIMRGRAQLGLEAWQAAIADVSDIINAQLKEPAAYYVRAYAYFKKGMEKEALADINQSINIRPTAEATFLRGQHAYGLKQGRRAINDLFTAVRLEPSFVEARLLLGSVQAGEGDYEKAIANLTEVIAQKGAYKNVYYERARALQATGEWEAAREDYKIYLKDNQQDAAAHFDFAVLLDKRLQMGLGSKDSVLYHFDRAIQLQPKAHEYLYQRALARSGMGNHTGALNDMRLALEEAPGMFEYYQARFKIQEVAKIPAANRIKDLESAVAFFRNETTKARKGPGFYNLARVFGLMFEAQPSQKLLDSALVNIEEALTNAKSDASYHLEKGRIQLEYAKDYDGAVASLRQGITLQPTSDAGRANLVRAFIGKGQFVQANAELKEALKKMPGNALLLEAQMALCKKYPEAC